MPPTRLTPGVYIQEVPSGARPVQAAASGVAAFVGRTATGPVGVVTRIRSAGQFDAVFGAPNASRPLGNSVHDFFAHGGESAWVVRLSRAGAWRPAFAALSGLPTDDGFDLLCVPPDAADGDTAPGAIRSALDLCVARRAFLVVDAPASWAGTAWQVSTDDAHVACGLPPGDGRARNLALFMPRMLQGSASRAACGAVAGLMAHTDRTRGIWRAAAGPDARLRDLTGLAVYPNTAAIENLTRNGINALRALPGASSGHTPGVHVVWGARTLAGADRLADEFRHIPVRRLALHIEKSVLRSTAWVIFEPNDEPLWAALRRTIDSFLNGLFRQGAFVGSSAKQAYFVKCDASTSTAADIAQGRVQLLLGFAPLKPAEFIVIRLTLPAAH